MPLDDTPPPRLALLFPGVSFGTRSRSLANRVMLGERIFVRALGWADRQAADYLVKRGVLTIEATTNILALTRDPEGGKAHLVGFPDGSQAERRGNRPWRVFRAARVDCGGGPGQAADFAWNQNRNLAALGALS